MNVALYGIGEGENRKWVMVDLGITFAGPDLPGIDLVLPDISFAEAERHSICGLILTHAHEDHFGAVLPLFERLKVPVFATKFTAGLLEAKRAENGGGVGMKIIEVRQDARFQVGPFDCELVSVAHSIPEPNALVFHREDGAIINTGDWKLDPEPVIGPTTNEKRFQELGDAGVAAMVCDSTNAFREGVSPSEGDVGRELKRIIGEASKRVAVTIFASNLARLKSVADAARSAGREVVLAGRAMHRMVGVARDTGYLDDGYRFLSEDDFGYLPRDKVLLLCTGSQGEPRAAISRIARDDHPRIALSEGDTVIFSSRTIPGNEKSVGAIQNMLIDSGMKLVTDTDATVHVSGHPRIGELKKLYDLVRPEVCVPAHGEARHLKAHAELARDCGVPIVVEARNGDVVCLTDEPGIVDDVPSGRWLEDGRFQVEHDDDGVKERRKLSFAGCVFVSLALSQRGEIPSQPSLDAFGLPNPEDNEIDLLDVAADAVDDALDALPKARRRDPDHVEAILRRAVTNSIRSVWGKKPLCIVQIHDVESAK
ncbi:MAG: ribonuclease J [Pseudomonadota bacterium]